MKNRLYIVLHPTDRHQAPLGLIDADGNIIGLYKLEHDFNEDPGLKLVDAGFRSELEILIEKIKEGLSTDLADNIICAPLCGPKQECIGETRKSKCTTLGKLLRKKEWRGALHLENLRPITEKNRYKGKVSWNSPSVRSDIKFLIEEKGYSLAKVAAHFEVTPGALSKANRKHRLYTPRRPIA